MWEYKDTLPAMNTIQMIHYTIDHFIPYYNNKIHSTIKMTPNDAYKGAFKNLLIDDQYPYMNFVYDIIQCLLIKAILSNQ